MLLKMQYAKSNETDSINFEEQETENTYLKLFVHLKCQLI